ncbi:hypothetical protein QN408_24870, partial [Pseudomonas sp. CCI4.2]|uniref:hypothetical protein n=1 Tax=Pseudomonas sp. CCI4.2 TaxID=3048620 RepID=UPI002B232FEF
MKSLNSPYYAATAYRADCIPKQQPSSERSWIRRFSKVRLPWGFTQKIAPDDFLLRLKPSTLRFQEDMNKEREEKQKSGTYIPAPYEHVDFHDRHDHERFRFSLWSKRSQFWIYLNLFGKWGFIIILPVYLMTIFAGATKSRQPYLDALVSLFEASAHVLLLPQLFCWAIAALVIRFLPHLWVKPSRGPIWEINRRTGLVTLFDYNNNGEYKKNGTIGELTAPFYEFDAYIATIPDRQGLSMNVLYIAHRYRDIVINFRPLFAPGEGQLCCALW